MAYKKTGDSGAGGGSAPADMDAFIFGKWQPFAETYGFVVNQAPAIGMAPDRELWTHLGSAMTPAEPYVFFRTKNDALFMMAGTAVNTMQEIFDQPDNPANGPDTVAFNSDWAGLPPNTLACPFVNGADPAGNWSGHHLFTDGDSMNDATYIHAVIQISARVWRHFHIGLLNKFGTWTGGTYIFGHFHHQGVAEITDPYSLHHASPLGGIRADTTGNRAQKGGLLHCEALMDDGPNNPIKWLLHTRAAYSASTDPMTMSKAVGDVNLSSYDVGIVQSNAFGVTMGYGLWAGGQSLIANASPLIPITMFGSLTFETKRSFAALGTIPDVYRINMKDYSPGETITVGSESYVVFPTANSNVVDTVNGDEYSGFEGLAYRIRPN